jgi:hypothetical protein
MFVEIFYLLLDYQNKKKKNRKLGTSKISSHLLAPEMVL